MARIIANVDYINGHLRYGHFELFITDNNELEKFKAMSEEEKKEYITAMGSMVIDDYRINDYGELGPIEIHE